MTSERSVSSDDGAPALPRGTVTFLFTDIEDSTRLWEQHPEYMTDALRLHDELLRDCVEQHGGLVVKTTGDGLHAVFVAAADALRAAVAGQRSLDATVSGSIGPLRVRMGLHTGEAELRDGDYFGTALNRAARLMAAAHGGQILVSHVTEAVLGHALAADVELTELGEYQLPDLTRPERVFQVLGDGLEPAFPPLRSPGSPRAKLPVILTSFIGRAAELTEATALVRMSRLVVLNGSGGCGKTRLAIELAHRVADDYADGAAFVDLAATSDAALVADSVCSALGLTGQAGRSALDVLVTELRDRHLLLVLDNCEHLIGACATLADRIVRECSGVTIVATSREVLAVAGETPWRVPSLAVPDSADESLDSFLQRDAVRLFSERAASVRPNFTITERTAPAVADIVRRLDGLPLAIELAAARIRALTPEQIAAGLEERFDVLGHGARTAVPRQQTLAASIEWSFDLLTEHERVLLRRLCVFAGGFTLDLAESVGAETPLDRYEVLELLTGLVDKSLIITEEQGTSFRYRMLETIRQYGRERLAAAGEEPVTRDRHLAAFLGLVDPGATPRRGAEEQAWLERLELEHGNLRGAFEWSRSSGQSDSTLRLAAALASFWYRRGHLREGMRNIRLALENPSDGDAAVRGTALRGLVELAIGLIDLETAYAAATESLGLARQGGDPSTVCRALNTAGQVDVYLDPARASALFDESLEVARSAGDLATVSEALLGLAAASFFVGDVRRAEQRARESLEVARREDFRQHVERAELILGCALILEGEIAEALPLLESTVDRVRRVGDLLWTTTSLTLLGEAYSLAGRYGDARRALEDALRVGDEIGTPITVATYFYRARIALAEGDPIAARVDLERAIAIDRQIGVDLWQCWHQCELALTLQLLGEAAAADAALREGTALAAQAGAERELALIAYAAGCGAHQAGDREHATAKWHEVLQLDQPDIVIVVDALEALACGEAATGAHEEALRLFGATEAVREAVGYVRPSVLHPMMETEIGRLRDAMDNDDFELRWSEGRALSLAEATAYATRARGERKRPSSGWASLTPTELDVVALLAEGLTNKVIAERLFVAPSTVKTHLSNVFTKLDVSTRSELTAAAVRRDL